MIWGDSSNSNAVSVTPKEAVGQLEVFQQPSGIRGSGRPLLLLVDQLTQQLLKLIRHPSPQRSGLVLTTQSLPTWCCWCRSSGAPLHAGASLHGPGTLQHHGTWSRLSQVDLLLLCVGLQLQAPTRHCWRHADRQRKMERLLLQRVRSEDLRPAHLVRLGQRGPLQHVATGQLREHLVLLRRLLQDNQPLGLWLDQLLLLRGRHSQQLHGS